MNLAVFLPLLLLVIASFEDVEVGSLIVSDRMQRKGLKILKATREGKLSIRGKRIYLKPDEDGALKEVTRQRYLNIDENGNVFFGKHAQPDFSVEFPTQQLLFKDKSGFVLCGDGSIGFRSDCVGSKIVVIIYKDHRAQSVFTELQPPNTDWYAKHLWNWGESA